MITFFTVFACMGASVILITLLLQSDYIVTLLCKTSIFFYATCESDFDNNKKATIKHILSHSFMMRVWILFTNLIQLAVLTGLGFFAFELGWWSLVLLASITVLVLCIYISYKLIHRRK